MSRTRALIARLRTLVAGWVLTGVAGAALAAPIPFSGTLAVDLGAFGGYTAMGVGVADVAPTGAFTLAGGELVLSTERTLPDFPSLPVRVRVIGANAPGTFAPGGGPAGGFGAEFVPVSGGAFVHFTATSGPPFFSLPLPLLGNGGTLTFPLFDLSTPTGNWTTGAATRVFMDDGVLRTVTLAGSDARTVGGLGTIQLVTPVTVLGLGALEEPVFATLTLTFVPEPGDALLVAAGVAGITALGRRRALVASS